jgi:hypothetical protein
MRSDGPEEQQRTQTLSKEEISNLKQVAKYYSAGRIVWGLVAALIATGAGLVTIMDGWREIGRFLSGH